MQVITQTLDEILASLRPLTVEWQDEVSQRVITRLKDFPIKTQYTEADVSDILNGGLFEDGMLIIRLFLGLSKDQYSAALRNALGAGGIVARTASKLIQSAFWRHCWTLDYFRQFRQRHHASLIGAMFLSNVLGAVEAAPFRDNAEGAG